MFVSTDRYLTLPRDPQKWIIKNLLPVGGIANIYGKPKAKKSFASTGMAQAIASGAPDWNGFPVLKPGKVFYLQIDTPRGEWADRWHRLKEAGFDVSNVMQADMLLTPSYPFNILDPHQHDWLKKQVELEKPVLVIIDTLREAHGADENNSTDMRNVITGIVSACAPAAVLLVSHARKDSLFSMTAGDDLMSDQRGSSYVSGRMDNVMRMTASGPADTDKERFTLTFKGRANGSGKVVLKVNTVDDTGLLVLDDEEEGYWSTLRNISTKFYQQNPTGPVSEIVTAVCEATKNRKSSRMTRNDIESHLTTLGWTPPRRGKTKAK